MQLWNKTLYCVVRFVGTSIKWSHAVSGTIKNKTHEKWLEILMQQSKDYYEQPG